jgi:two-component system cell cycle response regulator DivK
MEGASWMGYHAETPTVALVEDTPDSAELVKIMLAEIAKISDVRWFATGRDFLTTCLPGLYSLVLLDISLPDMDGYQIIRELRKIDADVPVIALSAYAFPSDRLKAAELGFNDYIVKPILDFDRFGEIVLRHIAKPG